SDRWMDRQEGR
ncbi:hypothetical protein BIW11_04467, partial [Tropilaelaps mercedesae]